MTNHIEFYVLRSLIGMFFKDDYQFKWVSDTESATLFSSVENLKKNLTFPLGSFRVEKYQLVQEEDKAFFTKEIIENSK